SQMNTSQFDYYFFLRDEIRSGRYPVADLSYILLFIYEIINLGNCSDNEKDISTLCGLWNAYRVVYPVLDKYLSEWAADYCLIHSVDLPLSAASVLPRIAPRSTLKEFYLEEAFKRSGDDISVFSECLISSCSDYVPEKSRYLSDNPDLLKKLKLIFCETVADMIVRQTGLFSPDSRSESVIKRDAYSGSLCSYNVKKRLSVTVRSPFRSQDFRREITEILRYCENIVRRNEGIRSRLTVDLPADIRNIIDNGFSSRPPGEEYLSFYDSPSGPVSIEGAIELENSSWESTERLVGNSFDEESIEEPNGALSYIPDTDEYGSLVTSNNTLYPPKPASIDFDTILSEMLNNPDLAFEDLCRDAGLFPDSVASEINESFSEEIGDIILDNSKGKYLLIEDYIEDIKDLIDRKGERNATG
ncbi:MAG: TerB N-terminal domain-containing protein, partial [Clostridia bacterium]|nr:TerB N-terminal domain-containing protein [Clostridia bacterium]